MKATANSQTLEQVFKTTLTIAIVALIAMWSGSNTVIMAAGANLATTLSTLSMIMIASILTAFGVYDKIGQFAGAGTIIPITGFANSVTSSAMEYKSEGVVTGIINNMLKLAGSIIVTGVISSFVVATILYFLGV